MKEVQEVADPIMVKLHQGGQEGGMPGGGMPDMGGAPGGMPAGGDIPEVD